MARTPRSAAEKLAMRKKKSRALLLFNIIAFSVVVIGAVLLCIFVFFKVGNVTFTSDAGYDEADIRRVCGSSTQHYAFVVNAFVSLVREYDRNRYEFSLRETSTAGIIDDVRVQRSELGVLYRCDFNESVISNVVKSADLHFVPLFRAKPHVFVSRNSPLAHLERVTLADLAPSPRLSYDQGIRNSLYYAEELHIAEAVDKSIVVTDRATLFNLIIGLDGYTISSGILSEDLNGSQIMSIPLESPEHMELGYVKRADRPLSSVAERYLQLRQEYVNEYQREAGE